MYKQSRVKIFLFPNCENRTKKRMNLFSFLLHDRFVADNLARHHFLLSFPSTTIPFHSKHKKDDNTISNRKKDNLHQRIK
jgi:hypothetical protein